MHLSFKASPRVSSDWIFLELLRDPSKKWRVDMYGQAAGEGEWLPLFSKVVSASEDHSAGEATSSPEILAAPDALPGNLSERPSDEATMLVS